MAFYQLKFTQFLPAPTDQVWDFIATPRNLKRITPSYMGFDILTKELSEKMYQGMMIAYTVRPVLHIPLTWVTEITHIREGYYFVDEQRVGPYTLWHHEHRIVPVQGGTLMHDLVSYVPPLGWLGQWMHPWLIRPRLNEIFEFRRIALEDIFGK
ncbi:MAG: SRPBCC family protein [Bacteroidales bacterium]